MTKSSCPPEHELFGLLEGETDDTELQTHVTMCRECGQRLDELTTEIEQLRSLPPIETMSTPTQPTRPATIGRYLVIGYLDAAGQSVVYRAMHPTLEKEVVIKLSRKPMDETSDQRHLLIAEGKHLAQLDHPNLVQIYDLDFHEGTPFLAMEFVRGPTLRAYAAEQLISPLRAAEITAQVARALEVVHRHGILHQDIKPQNIILDEHHDAKLIDFGIARLRHAWDSGAETFSGGTPSYMAPEQALCQQHRLGPRSDIFALGAVLYSLLTGKPPFQGETTEETLEKAGRCDFDRTALQECRAPARLKAICLKAMEEDPSRRFASAGELARALEKVVEQPRIRRRAFLLGAVAVGVGAAVWLWPRNSTDTPPASLPPPSPEADLKIQVARGESYFPLTPEVVPLKSIDDRLQIVGKVPLGWHACLYNLDAVGKVTRLPIDVSDADDFQRVVYPGDGKQATLDPEVRGTEMLLLVSAKSAERIENLEPTIERTLRDLPVLPPHVLVWIDREQPKREVHRRSPIGAPRSDPVAEVEARMDKLRQALRQEASVFRGVAFSHR